MDLPLEQRATIVALTAYTNPGYMKQCYTVGMSKILNKPAKKKEVDQVIRKYCPFLGSRISSSRTIARNK